MSEPATRPRPDRALALLVLLGVLVRVAVACRPLLQVDDLAIPDDAYLSLTLARSIAHGLGPFYGLAPTNGFQPLYVFLMAPAFGLFGGDPFAPVRIAQGLLIACDALALILLYRLIARTTRSAAPPRLLALAWAIDPAAILTSLNALETTLTFLLLLVAIGFWYRLDAADVGGVPGSHAFGLGALVGLAGLARIDSLLLLPALAVGLRLRHARAGVSPRRDAVALVWIGAGALLVQLPWLAYSWHWTRELLPVSARAVRFQCLSSVAHAPTLANLYLPVARHALSVVVARNAARLALIAALAAVLVCLGRAAWREVRARLAAHAVPLIFGALILAAYVGVIFGPWHFPRYFFPLALPLALVGAALLDVVLARVGAGTPRALVTAAATLLLVAGCVLHPAFRRLASPGAPGAWGYMRIGLWARDHVSPGTVIGGTQTGALGYFAEDLTVVNLDGVVNRAAYDALRARRALDYVRAAGVRFLVWQDDIEFLARESRGAPAVRLRPLETVPGIRTMGEPWRVWRVEEALPIGRPASTMPPP